MTKNAIPPYAAPLVLYVDDEHANRVVFQQAFGKKFNVKVAESGQAALELLANEPVALLLTDQRMPGMSGDELLERFKELSPETVRIVVTAYSDLEPILKAVNEGLAVRYLIKPWDRTELEQILRWAIEVHELGRKNSAVQMRLFETERVLTLGQVTAAVIHDLAQPLSSVKVNAEHFAAYADLADVVRDLAEKSTLPVPTKVRLASLASDLSEVPKDIVQSAHVLATFLEQLRDFQKSRVTVSQPGVVDVVPLVRMVLQMCRGEARACDCTLVDEVPKDTPAVQATTSHVLQILINLVRNGVQAVGRTGKAGAVVVSAADRGKDVRFTVRDDGEGMTPSVLGQIGRPFFTSRPDGMGLGVGQVMRIIGIVGGNIDFQSVVGRGTTVTFTIPRATASEATGDD